MDKKRVVVTGLGVVCPLGNSVGEFWQATKEGKNGIGPLVGIDTTDLAVKFGGEVKNFDPTIRMDPRESRKMDKVSQFAVYAALEAFEDASLKVGDIDPTRLGLVLGSGMGGIITLEESTKKLFEKGPSRMPPMTIVKVLPNIAAANIAILVNAQGPSQCITTACAAGTDAIGNAFRWIQTGDADVMIAGGAETPVTRMSIASFSMIQALSTRNDDPAHASRPFDKDRDGFVMSEGSGMIVLEEYEHAKKRGARMYCELVGYGASCDAHHLTAPHPDGIGAANAMTKALASAGMKPEDIDYINAHGTSTPINDPTETQAIKRAFGDHAYKLKISSTKSMTGHCVGAAGGVEAVVLAMAIKDQFFPPTINLENPDPACDLDYVPNKGYHGKIRAAMSDSMGFGGQNGVIIFKAL